MSTKHLLISTGQNISNLIPLLQFANIEDDIVVLESTTSQLNGWGFRFRELLRKKDYRHIQLVEMDDSTLLNPVRLFHRIKGFIEHPINTNVSVYLNGGQKLAAVALLHGLGTYNPKLIYMEHSPARIRVLDDLKGKATFREVPITFPVDLRDILSIYASELHGSSQMRPVYLETCLMENRPSETLASFWRESEYSHTLLLMYGRQAVDDAYKAAPFTVDSNTLKDTVRKKMLNSPLDSIRFAKPFNNTSEKRVDFVASFIKSVINKVSSQTGRADVAPRLPLSDAVRNALIVNGFLDKGFDKNSVSRMDFRQRLGTYFENVVFLRLLHLMEKHPELNTVISQIWRNIVVCKSDESLQITGEYDILLVLKNGILISLECKSYDFNTKDAFSRIARLARRGGGQARQWVTAPLFTGSGLFHPEMYVLYERMKSFGIPFVPFTMNGQPGEIMHLRTGKMVRVATFEETLLKLLSAWLP